MSLGRGRNDRQPEPLGKKITNIEGLEFYAHFSGKMIQSRIKMIVFPFS